MLSSVETAKLEQVEKRLWEVLENIVAEPLDIPYLRDCARRLQKHIVYDTETDLGSFTTDLIYDHLYGRRDGADLEDNLKSLQGYEEVINWSERQWKEFLNKYFVKNNHVSVLGVPSAKVSEKLKTQESARIEKRLKDLGPEGLNKLARDLEQAKKDNEPTIPDRLFQDLPVPSSDTIPWMETTTAQTGPNKSSPPVSNAIQNLVDADAKDFPLFVHFEHMPAKCVYLSVLFFAAPVPTELKPLFSIFLTNFYASPIMRDGQRIEFEDVIKELERDTISYAIECGALSHPELVRIRMVVEPEKYATGIQWLYDLIFNHIFDVERLQTAVGKMLADIPSYKREGDGMAAAIDKMIHLDAKSAKRAQSTLVQALYLKRIKRLLRTKPGVVISDLEKLCKSLFTFQNMRGLVSADVENLENPVSSWKLLIEKLDTKVSLIPIPPQIDFYSDKANQPGSTAYIVPMSTVDSSFGYLTTKALGGYFHSRLPALLLALTYLDTADGPLWVAVRGSGLAYGTNFIYSQITGLLKLSIYRSPDAFKAFDATRTVIASFVEGHISIDRFALEGAVSNLVLSFANEQSTIVSAGMLGFVNPVILGIPRDYGKQLLRDVRKVTVEDVVSAMRDLIMPIFKYESTNMVITCAPSMIEVSIISFASMHDILANTSDRVCEKISSRVDSKQRSRLSSFSKPIMVLA
jgi:Zn-dependent M16 (insulinase) family peptidase